MRRPQWSKEREKTLDWTKEGATATEEEEGAERQVRVGEEGMASGQDVGSQVGSH